MQLAFSALSAYSTLSTCFLSFTALEPPYSYFVH